MPLDKRFVYYLLAAKGICVVPISSFCSDGSLFGDWLGVEGGCESAEVFYGLDSVFGGGSSGDSFFVFGDCFESELSVLASEFGHAEDVGAPEGVCCGPAHEVGGFGGVAVVAVDHEAGFGAPALGDGWAFGY